MPKTPDNCRRQRSCHAFRFITPATTTTLKVPNACAACHASEPPDFASKALKELVKLCAVTDIRGASLFAMFEIIDKP